MVLRDGPGTLNVESSDSPTGCSKKKKKKNRLPNEQAGAPSDSVDRSVEGAQDKARKKRSLDSSYAAAIRGDPSLFASTFERLVQRAEQFWQPLGGVMRWPGTTSFYMQFHFIVCQFAPISGDVDQWLTEDQQRNAYYSQLLGLRSRVYIKVEDDRGSSCDDSDSGGTKLPKVLRF